MERSSGVEGGWENGWFSGATRCHRQSPVKPHLHSQEK